MISRLKVIIIASIALILMVTASYAENMKGNLYAITNVRPAIKHVLHHKANSFTVTQIDIEKGYVDVQKALVYSMTSNSTNGHLLVFAYDSSYIKQLIVLDGKNVYPVSESDGEVHMPYQGNNLITKELTFRLHLLSGVKPGVYQIPVEVMLSAI